MSDALGWFIRHVSWPFYIERDAPGTLAEWRSLEDSQRWPAERLRELRRARLREMLVHAAGQVPFYERRFGDAGVDPRVDDPEQALAALPPLEKRDIQDARRELRARNVPASELVENRTGGSTGAPLAFDLDRARSASRYAASLRHDRWAGWEPGDRVVALWGANRDTAAPSTLKEKLRAVLCDRLRALDTTRISEEQLDAFALELPRMRPGILIGYARSLALVARHVAARGIRVPTLRAVVSSAEVLDPGERAQVESAFGAPVFDRYGSREVSVIASECEAHRGMHLNAENLWLEIVDGAGRPVAAGTTGEILVTDLRNRGMPLLRYRIGDVGALLAGMCPCGRSLPLLGPVTGRVTDFLLLPDGARVSGIALAYPLVAQVPRVRQVQLFQPRREELVVRVVPAQGFDAATECRVRELASRFMGPGVSVRVERVVEIAPEASGKHRLSISEAT